MTTKTTAPQPAAGRADLAALGLSRKTVDCHFKSIDDDGTFTVYFGAFGNLDRGGDILEPKSVRNPEEYVRDGWVAWNHMNHLLPIAYATAIQQDQKGILVTGKFHSTPEAQAVRTVAKERMEAGKTVPGSIGYTSAEESFEKVNGQLVRRLKQIDLYECSFVNLPMNPAATAASIKSVSPPAETTEVSMSENISEKGAAALAALKEWFGGISTKESKPMSKAGMTRLKAFAEAMDEHGGAAKEHAKAMHEHAKAACAMGKEMKGFLKAYDPDNDGDDDSTEEGDTDNDREEVVAKKPGKKKKKPEDKEDEPEDKSAAVPKTKRETPESLLREQLRHRALLGRRQQSSP